MGAFIAKQPNGLYARFSTVVDTVTHINMTREQYIKMRVAEATKTAIKELDNPEPFENILEYFSPNNHTVTEFNEILNMMGSDVQLDPKDYDYEGN